MRRRTLEKILSTVVIPSPWDVEQLCQSLSRTRGRPVNLVSRPGRPDDEIYASVLSTDAADYIFVRDDLKGLHRDQAICHEIGHLLAGHTSRTQSPLDAWPADIAELDTSTIAGLMHRSCEYGDRRERDAEAIGSALLSKGREHLTLSGDPIARGFGQALR